MNQVANIYNLEERTARFGASVILFCKKLNLLKTVNCKLKIAAYLLICIFAYLLIFLPPVFASSGINSQINFQGKLVDNNGLTVTDGTGYQLVFKLYNVSSSGTAIWTETQSSVSVTNGIFHVALGSVTPLTSVDFNNSQLYLGIQVTKDANGNATTDSEMTPRIQFAASPYAFNANSLDGVVATNSASQFTISGSTTSLLTLTVNGSLTLGSTIQPTANGALTLESTGANGLTLDTGGAAAVNIGNTNATSLNFGNSSTTAFTFNHGNVGIGTSNALATLDARASAYTTPVASISGATGLSTLVLDQSGVGDIFTASQSGGTRFVIGNNGSIKSSKYNTSNGLLYVDSNGLFAETAPSTGLQCLITASAGVAPTWGACSSGVTWDTIGNPAASKTFDFGTYTTTFSTTGNTSTNNIFTFSDSTNNTGTGYVLTAGTNAGSAAKPFRIQTQGTTVFDTNTSNGLVLGAATGNGNVLIQPNAGGQAALVIEDQGSGDILTASAGATTKFIVHNDGSIQTLGGNSTADITSVTAGNGLTIMPKANSSGAGGGLTLKGGNGSGAAGGVLTLDAGTGSSNGTISIGTTNASAITIASSSITTTVQGSLVVGVSGNTITLNPSSGPTYAGNARVTKVITLSPEYAGAVLTASGSATTNGTMTADASPSASLWRTHYSWTTTQSSLQDYTVAVRVTLPQDFSDWPASNALTIDYDTMSTQSTNNALDVYIYNKDATNTNIPVYFSTNNTSSTQDTWTTLSLGKSLLVDGTDPDWATPGQTAVILLKMHALNTYHTLVGDIKLTYLAKF